MILSGQGFIQGIALNPNDGYSYIIQLTAELHSCTYTLKLCKWILCYRKMYWTRCRAQPYRCSISKAELDGGNPRPRVIVDELEYPRGIAIDYIASRILWTDYHSNKIQWSDFDGQNVQTVANQTSPLGIAVCEDNLYVGSYQNNTLQIGDNAGANFQTLYSGASSVNHLTVVRAVNPEISRPNHCAGNPCATFCILTRNYFHCVE